MLEVPAGEAGEEEATRSGCAHRPLFSKQEV
jgi:hypothetical protein